MIFKLQISTEFEETGELCFLHHIPSDISNIWGLFLLGFILCIKITLVVVVLFVEHLLLLFLLYPPHGAVNLLVRSDGVTSFQSIKSGVKGLFHGARRGVCGGLKEHLSRFEPLQGSQVGLVVVRGAQPHNVVLHDGSGWEMGELTW